MWPHYNLRDRGVVGALTDERRYTKAKLFEVTRPSEPYTSGVYTLPSASVR